MVAQAGLTLLAPCIAACLREAAVRLRAAR